MVDAPHLPTTRGARWRRRFPVLGWALLLWFGGLLSFGQQLEATYPDLAAIPARENAVLALDLLVGQLTCLALVPYARTGSPARARWAGLTIVALSAVSSWSFVAALWAIVRLSGRRTARWIAAVDVVAVGAAALSTLILPTEPFGVAEVVLGLVLLAALNLWGAYRGQRAALLTAYRDQADTLQREREAVLARARAEERTAIAREMHDTLSHRLAVISLHAGGLTVRRDLTADQVQETATLIQGTAQAASEELHELLTILRDEPGDRQRPASVEDLDELVAGARESGTSVSLALDPALRTQWARLTPRRSAALAHAVREGLANTTKHAPGAPVEVRVTERDGGVVATVSNPLVDHTTDLAGGHGLIGLAERLRLAEGRLTHGLRDGQYRLQAWVPWS